MQLGKYKHFKGSIVEVIAIANHSETREKMVVYKKLEAHNGYPAGTVWVRPLDMFLEHVEENGKTIPRFEFMGE